MFKITHAPFWKLSATALLVALAAVLCFRLCHPWTYNDDYNGAFWAQAARNLSQAGVFSTAGIPAPLYFGRPPIPSDALYVHHPALLANMMLLDRVLLGESEWAARLLPVCFSVLTALLLWLFASQCLGWRGGALVLSFFVASPMELHYGQMVNFEAPELFFLLAALCSFHLWRIRRTGGFATGLLLWSVLAMWTDWQGYLLVMLLAAQLLFDRRGRQPKMAAALLLAAIFCGAAFLLQIRFASADAWHQLLNALRERSSHSTLSGGTFTAAQWFRTELGYLTTFYHPVAWVLAAAGAIAAIRGRDRLSVREAALLHIGAILFLIAAIYICGLRNQSFIHDFASFYFLVPVAVFSGFCIEWILRQPFARSRRGQPIAVACACGIAVLLVVAGIHRLQGIDTQFCILDDNSDPPKLMPDAGHLIDQSVPVNAVVICNFDQYYSPLPYYARRIMANYCHTCAEWRQAVSDAEPLPAAGIIWNAAPDAPDLLRSLPPAELHPVSIDHIPFTLWLPAGALHHS